LEEFMNRIRIALAASAMTLLGSAPMMAQTCATNPCTVAVTTSATVNDVLRLTLDQVTLDLGTPSETDYDAGFKDAASHRTATVKSNRPWHVAVVGNAAAFSYSGSLTNPTKTAADLVWAKTAGSLGSPDGNMGTSSNLANGTTGTASTSQDIYFRTKWFWASDVPGSYSLVVNFTLSAP
jgi:hypothetical protein